MSAARFSTLADWLAWQEGLHPSAIDMGNERLTAVARILFGEHFATQRPRTITVAGTNGKGSCVTTIAALAAASGLRVGSFTSPHLQRYNERIRINGEEASDAQLCAAFNAIDQARAEISLTYFEFNALAALWLFREEQVDLQVLEVGLGGRLDAVNIIDADIAVITNIALDHIDWLGDNRESIGAEKAGILRHGIPLVYGEADMPASVRAAVQQHACPLYHWGETFGAQIEAGQWVWQGVDAQGLPLMLQSAAPQLPLPSVACALQALVLAGVWQPQRFATLLPQLRLAGRMETRQWQGLSLLCDVAHNTAGAQFLARRLANEYAGERIAVLFSAMADKDLDGIIRALAPQVCHWYIAPLNDNPRAATAAQLHQAVQQAGVDAAQVQLQNDIAAALQQAKADATQFDRLLVCGSFFTVAAVKAL